MSLEVNMTSVRRVNAPRQVVWQVFSDFVGWPLWNPSTRLTALEGGPGGAAVGARLRLVVRPLGLPLTVRARVVQVHPGRRLSIVVHWMGITGWQTFSFSDMGQGTLVEAREMLSGWLLAPLYLLRAPRRVGGMVSGWLEALAVEAERRQRTSLTGD